MERQLSYQYTDANGYTSNIATVKLAISPINDTPIIDETKLQSIINGQEIIAGTPVSLSLTATGSDVEGDTLSIIITEQPKHGSITQQPDGSYTLIFDIDYEGQDSFSYTITDGNSQATPVSATINLLPSNKAPIAIDGQFTLNEDGTVTLTIDQLGNDPDGDPMTITIHQAPEHGTLTQQTNPDGKLELIYTPDADYNGTDSFSYSLADAKVSSSIATATLAINAVNDAPVVTDTTVTTNEDTPTIINVKATTMDIDNDVSNLTPVIWVQAHHGKVSINTDGYHQLHTRWELPWYR